MVAVPPLTGCSGTAGLSAKSLVMDWGGAALLKGVCARRAVGKAEKADAEANKAKIKVPLICMIVGFSIEVDRSYGRTEHASLLNLF